MAFYDAPLLLSSAQAISSSTTSTTIYDVTGAGSGNAPSMTFGNAAATAKGFDIGNGDGLARPTANFTVTTAGSTSGGSVKFAVQAAPDNGSNAPGTYVTLSEATYTAAALQVGDTINLPVPPYAPLGPGLGVPRFYQFAYTTTGATVAVSAYIGINVPTGYSGTQYSNNYTAV
jgi:hypothetical protein